MQYATDIGQSVTEVVMNLAQYVFEDVEQLELEGEVITAENFDWSMDGLALGQARHAVDLMSPAEIERLIDEYDRDKAIDIHLRPDGMPIFCEQSDILYDVLMHELEPLVTYTYYQMWKDNGGRISHWMWDDVKVEIKIDLKKL